MLEPLNKRPCAGECTCEPHKPDWRELTPRNVTAIGLIILAIPAVIAALVVDELSILRDDNDKAYASCSWEMFEYASKPNCDDTVPPAAALETTGSLVNLTLNDTTELDTYLCLSKTVKFDEQCSEGSFENWCDTRDAGIIWLTCAVCGVFLVFVNIPFNCYNMPRTGGAVGFVGWIGLLLAVSGWMGLEFDFNFEFDGNPVCFDVGSDHLAVDAKLDIGDSIYIMFGGIVLSFAGWAMSCMANRGDDTQMAIGMKQV